MSKLANDITSQVAEQAPHRYTIILAESADEVIVARRKRFDEPNLKLTLKINFVDVMRQFGTQSLTVISSLSLIESGNPDRESELESLLRALMNDTDNELIVTELSDDEVCDIPVYERLGFVARGDLGDRGAQVFTYQNAPATTITG